MRLARRLCAAVLALTLAPIVALASGPYPIQSASSTSNDFQSAPQLLSAACGTPNYIVCPANSTAGVNLVATSLASIAMSGGATMTSQVEISYNGVNFFTVPVFPAGSGTSQTNITADGTYTTPTFGATVIQVRTTSYTSGAETVIIHLATSSVTSSSGSGGGGGGGGSVTITNPVDGSGNVKVAQQGAITITGTTAVSISGTPTFNCGTGCGNAPLAGGATAVATGANQAVAIAGYNGTTLDAIAVSPAGTPVGNGVAGVQAVQGIGAAGAMPVISGSSALNVQGTGTGNGINVLQASGANLHISCDAGCGAAPPWKYTATTGTSVVVVKATPGTFAGIQNLSTSAQTTGMTCTWYDNASAASGQVLYTMTQMGAGQVVSFGAGAGILTNNGLTMQCTGGTPGGSGVMTLWL